MGWCQQLGDGYWIYDALGDICAYGDAQMDHVNS
jgi:hypothetical protein